MVSSISSSSSYIQQLMAEMMKNLASASTDKTSGVSQDELSSVSAGKDVGGANFLKTLSDNFDAIDTDGNGQLSSEEISSFNPTQKGQMGPPPGLVDELFSNDSDSSSGLTVDELSSLDATAKKGLNNCVDNLVKNFDKLDTNGDGQLSADEIAASKPSGPPPNANQTAAAADSSDSSDAVGSFAKQIADFLSKQLKEVYKDSLASLSSLTSSTEVAA